MNYESKLKFLDDILKSLFKSGAHKLYLTEMNSEVYKGDYENKSDGIERKFIGVYDPANELENALNYLEIEGYVSSEYFEARNNLLIYLNYKGILKLSNGGFVQEYKKRKKERNLLNNVNLSTTFSNIFSIIIAVIALIISYLAYNKP